MSVIKFNSDKADALIRDLNKISADIESNLRSVYANSYGKEINLSSSSLKVYAYRDKIVDIVQEDGTIVQETIKEKYLKHDYVSNARLYNQSIRNLNKCSNNEKNKTLKYIESVIISLNKIKSLINDYESDSSLKMDSNLVDIGQFDFNFLSAYGSMGGACNYSSSLGTIVADEVYTSLYLGILGERPTSLNLEKLKVFDDILEIVANERLSYQEKFNDVKSLLKENILDVDSDLLDQKAKMALESMVGIIESKDIKIDDNLRIESLIKLGVPIINRLESSELAIDLETESVGMGNVEGADITIATDLGANSSDVSVATNIEENSESELSNDNAEISNTESVLFESQSGITSHVKSGKVNHGLDNVMKHMREQNSQEKVQSSERTEESSLGKNSFETENVVSHNMTKKNELAGHKSNGSVAEKNTIDITQDIPRLANTKSDDVKVPINDEIKLTSEELALDQELQRNKISLEYVAPTTESKVIDSIENAIDSGDVLEKKGVGVVAGVAGIGALSNMAGGNSNSIPQVNIMAAGDILGINNSVDNSNTGVLVDSSVSVPSTGSLQTNPSASTSAKIESTSDRGSLSTTNDKVNNTSASRKGGSTLEDKDDKENENTYGKPNKIEDAEENNQKGLLGDASIAELDAKDEKNIKIATGVTAGFVLTSSILALANVLSWLMIILAIIALIAYCGYRMKKKKDKQKRREKLEASKQVEQVVPTITLENVQKQN